MVIKLFEKKTSAVWWWKFNQFQREYEIIETLF